jgi:SAM-dependent methyltransferase
MDYSLPAVELAKRLVEQDKANVNIFLGDILDGNTFKDFTGCVDVCVDKGTFDAISLSMDKVNEKKDKYRQSIISLLKDDGLFMIVSCNWTETELIDFFSEVRLVPMDTIPAPLIKFGGVTGQTTSTVIFKRNC